MSGHYSYGGGSSGGSGQGGSGGYRFGHRDPSKSKSSGGEWTCRSFWCETYGGTKTTGTHCRICNTKRPDGSGCNPDPPGPSGGSSSGSGGKKSSSSKTKSSSSKKKS